MERWSWWLLVALTVACASGRAARADSTLQFQVHDATRRTALVETVRISTGRVRIDGEGGAQRFAILYRAGEDHYTLLRPADASYITVSPVQMALRLGKGHGPAYGGALRYEKTGRRARVGRWLCRIFEMYRGGKRSAELCMATAGAVGISRSDYRTLRAMYRFAGRFAAHGMPRPGGADHLPTFPGSIEGIAVRIRHLDQGGFVAALERVSTGRLASGWFDVPAGYRESKGLP